MGTLRLEAHLGLDELCACEFYAMLIIAEERNLLERENTPAWKGGGPT